MTAGVLDRATNSLSADGAVVGMVSTWPPTKCGLATFAAALSRSMSEQGHRIVPVDVRPAGQSAGHVSLVAGDASALQRSVRVLNACDVVIVQHEFGIFGGDDGDEVLDLLSDLTVPVIVVLHTVPAEPTYRQSTILTEVCKRVDVPVVMAVAARDRLAETYHDIDTDRVVVIPHGAALPDEWSDQSVRQPFLLTWGLLGPGKGIEHVIRALSILHDRGEDIAYTIAGVTHPNVLVHEGEKYRDVLRELARAGGIQANVQFDEAYRTAREVTDCAASALATVLPYDATDQVTSGVLVDALAAGRPVIATRFPHAVELLSGGAGIVVPHRDPQAMADAIHELVSRPRRVRKMTARARRLAPTLSWAAVAEEYGRLCRSLLSIQA